MVIFDRTMLSGAGNQFINPDYLRPLSPLPSEVRPRRTLFFSTNKFIKRGAEAAANKTFTAECYALLLL
jgi:hypothetical protein